MKVITSVDKEPTHIVWDSDESASDTDTSDLSTAPSSTGVPLSRRAKTRGERNFHRPSKADFLDGGAILGGCNAMENQFNESSFPLYCPVDASYYEAEPQLTLTSFLLKDLDADTVAADTGPASESPPPSDELAMPTSVRHKRTRPSKGKRQQGKRMAQNVFEQCGNEQESVEKLCAEGASRATLAYAQRVLDSLRSEAAQKRFNGEDVILP